MARTKAQLRNDVLEDLGVLPAGASPSGADAAAVETAMDLLNAELRTEGKSYWQTSSIPDDVAEPFAAMVAARVARKFELDEQAIMALRSEANVAYTRLSAMVMRQDDTGEPVRGQYF